MLEPKEAEAALHDLLGRLKRADPKAQGRASLFSGQFIEHPLRRAMR